MPIELIDQLGKHGLIGLAAAAALYLASKAIERGFSLTINAPPTATTRDTPARDDRTTPVLRPRPDEPRQLPAARPSRKKRRGRRRRDQRFQ